MFGLSSLKLSTQTLAPSFSRFILVNKMHRITVVFFCTWYLKFWKYLYYNSVKWGHSRQTQKFHRFFISYARNFVYIYASGLLSFFRQLSVGQAGSKRPSWVEMSADQLTWDWEGKTNKICQNPAQIKTLWKKCVIVKHPALLPNQ